MLNRLDLTARYDLALSDSNFLHSRYGGPDDRGDNEGGNGNDGRDQYTRWPAVFQHEGLSKTSSDFGPPGKYWQQGG